jgi:hypothetical protein
MRTIVPNVGATLAARRPCVSNSRALREVGFCLQAKRGLSRKLEPFSLITLFVKLL